jgi:small subunit ribosomal protein S4e
MHQTRFNASLKLPIKRKGTKYLARAISDNDNSVPVIIALRDMLGLAKTSAEVKSMIHRKLIKLNGRLVSESSSSIKLFNILEADKSYTLSLSSTGKFILEESKDTKLRLCKITGKTLIGKGKIQFNLHDGSNLISKEKLAIGDSVYLDMSGKMVKHKALDKGTSALVISGKYMGTNVKVDSVKEGKVSVSFTGGKAELNKSAIAII